MSTSIYCPLECKALLDMSHRQLDGNERVQFGCLAYIEQVFWRDDGILKVEKCLARRKPKKGWRLTNEDGAERDDTGATNEQN